MNVPELGRLNITMIGIRGISGSKAKKAAAPLLLLFKIQIPRLEMTQTMGKDKTLPIRV
jgi:hypothetical protein